MKNKVVLITGASGGIGAATALSFSNHGAKVAIAARRTDRLNDLALQMDQPLIIPVDLSEPGQSIEMVQRVVAHFGRIDVLINNAASIIVSSSDAVTSNDLMKAFSTNCVAPVTATQEAIRHMREQGGGQIINIGSPGFMMGIPFYAPYVCSKAALSAWTRTIQSEWANSEIRVCEYFPGYIKTESKPESRIGEVEQDFLMTRKQNFFTRHFTKPKTPEQIAEQLIRLVKKPRQLTYSDFSVHLGAYLSNISIFRLAIAKQMARTARSKKNLPIFTSPSNPKN